MIYENFSREELIQRIDALERAHHDKFRAVPRYNILDVQVNRDDAENYLILIDDHPKYSYLNMKRGIFDILFKRIKTTINDTVGN